ncbi:hypothetical protein ACFOY8_13465 [Thalassospira xianhensis]|nr:MULTISPECIES: hypothetical protein [Thalassospira]SOC27000.1 hypothetical protein SAMN05428964_105249 [Thalassospira xiamenensis]
MEQHAGLRSEIIHGHIGTVDHGECLGLHPDGRMVFWDAAEREPVISEHTPETYPDINKLSFWEQDKLARDGWRPVEQPAFEYSSPSIRM